MNPNWLTCHGSYNEKWEKEASNNELNVVSDIDAAATYNPCERDAGSPHGRANAGDRLKPG